jgi:adenine C2-methylase RlmN of 23S rRNA A2503 and tRNA A37
VDLTLLEETLRERGEPAYRVGQVWDWAAGGAAGYDAMSNLPGALRKELAGAVRTPVAVPVLAVGLPVDVHVLRDRPDGVRP